MQVLVHVIVVGVMLRFPRFELTLDPPGRSVWVFVFDLLNVVGFAPFPIAIDQKHFDHGTLCHKV